MSHYRNQRQNPPVWVSQNFLTSKRTLIRLIRKTSITADDHVIEIGPGKGHITDILLQHSRKVSAIEIDKNLYDRLAVKYGECKKLKLYHQDFLKWRLPVSGDYKVFTNTPFCHTTDILRKLTECKNLPSEVWLTMEKGAAKRFMGIPHENLRSLMLKPFFDIRIIYHFRREDFHPMPGTDIVMVHLKRKTPCDIPVTQWQNYRYFVSNSLKNNKAGLLRLFTKKQLSRACKKAGVNNFAAGEMLYVQWLCLFRCYYEHARIKA